MRPAAHPMVVETMARKTALWNQLIPPRALGVRDTPNGRAIEYLHPTKGWKRVSKRRLGL